jgi:hypothetical protein
MNTSNAEMQLMHQVAFLSMQLMEERNKNQIWVSLVKSLDTNPTLQTAWSDFIMILKLSDSDVSAQIDTITNNYTQQ